MPLLAPTPEVQASVEETMVDEPHPEVLTPGGPEMSPALGTEW